MTTATESTTTQEPRCPKCGHTCDTDERGICQTQIGARNWAYCHCRCTFLAEQPVASEEWAVDPECPTLEEAETFLRAQGINPADLPNQFIEYIGKRHVELARLTRALCERLRVVHAARQFYGNGQPQTSPVHTEAAPEESPSMTSDEREQMKADAQDTPEAAPLSHTPPHLRAGQWCDVHKRTLPCAECAPVAESAGGEKRWESRHRVINSAECLTEEMQTRLRPNPKKAEAGRLGGMARQEKLRKQPCLACAEGRHDGCVKAVLNAGRCGCFCVFASTQSVTPAGGATRLSIKARESIHEAAELIANRYCGEDDTFFFEVARLEAGIVDLVDSRVTTPAASGVDEAITAVHKVWADTPSSEWYQSKDELTAAWACHNKVVDALTALRGKEK